VKIHSTASSVKSVKTSLVSQLGVNASPPRLPVLLDLLDHPAHLVIPVNLVPLDLVVTMVLLDPLLPLAQLKIPHASNAPQDLLVLPAPMAHPDLPAQMVNLVLLVLVVDKDLPDLLDLLEMLDQTETLDLLVNPDLLETMELVVLVLPDPKVLLETLVLPELLDPTETPVALDKMVLLAQLVLLETPVLLDQMVNLVPLVVPVFLVPMPHIVLAPLVQLSSSAADLKLAKSAHSDHDSFFFNETIKVVFALCTVSLYSQKRK